MIISYLTDCVLPFLCGALAYFGFSIIRDIKKSEKPLKGGAPHSEAKLKFITRDGDILYVSSSAELINRFSFMAQYYLNSDNTFVDGQAELAFRRMGACVKAFCEQHGITADEIDQPDYALLFNIQYPGVVR